MKAVLDWRGNPLFSQVMAKSRETEPPDRGRDPTLEEKVKMEFKASSLWEIESQQQRRRRSERLLMTNQKYNLQLEDEREKEGFTGDYQGKKKRNVKEP